MIRPMRDSDWKYVAEIYQQGIDSGISILLHNARVLKNGIDTIIEIADSFMNMTEKL